MPSDDPTLRALLTLRVAGFVDSPVVASRSGLALSEVAELLADAAERGWVTRRDGARPGWSLTATGRAAGEARLSADLDEAGVRDHLADGYRRFLDLNGPLLDLCTRWQIVDLERGVLNDHADASYDAARVAELGDLHRRARPVVHHLASARPRFGDYGRRLDLAFGHVDAGETDWFARPTIDSYHTVWFELHEDLLATLGIDRAAEPVGKAR